MPRYYDKRVLLTILGTLKEAGLSHSEAAWIAGISSDYANKLYCQLPAANRKRAEITRLMWIGNGIDRLAEAGYTDAAFTAKQRMPELRRSGGTNHANNVVAPADQPR